MIKKEQLTIDEQILMFAGVESPYMALGVKVAQSAGIAEDGKKYVYAGTPLTGDIVERTASFTSAGTGDVKGVLLHKVDVTDGDANGTLLIFGAVNLNRLKDSVKTLLTEDVKTTLDGKVWFLKG